MITQEKEKKKKKALNELAWTIVNLKETDYRIASSPVISVKIK